MVASMTELQYVMRQVSQLRQIKQLGPLYDEQPCTIQNECQQYIDYQKSILTKQDQMWQTINTAQQQLNNLYS